jgi:hypothetical protein
VKKSKLYPPVGSAATPLWVPALLGALTLLSACAGAEPSNPKTDDDPPPYQPGDCNGAEVAMPKRIIRLSFGQIAQSLRPVFGDEFAAKVLTDNQIAPPTERTFPPLGDTSEGSSYIDAKWQSADAIATAAGKYASDNFAGFTGCGDAPTPECAQAFVSSLAERAYRRPLDDREKTSLLQVYTEVIAGGGTVQQAVQAAVSAVFSSPHFLYRTELGAPGAAETPLTPYELASQLSYFLTDGPPDAELLAAAAQNELSTATDVALHVDRLLALPQTRQNLQDTVLAAFGIARVKSVVIDGLPPDQFNAGVANSMFRESQLFVNDVLWNGGKVSDLATSRRSFINAQLAPLYGVAAPTAGLDADGFGLVELPDHRSGILTSVGFLTSRSRPDQQSVVGRGLAVNDAILCQQNPPFPEALADQIEAVNHMLDTMTEREKADYRGITPPCSGCHLSFDPYGVSLENFDLVGRYRTVDDHGRPIDAAVTLPEIAGGGTALTASEMGQALATSGAFASCVATKLLTYALAETGVSGDSCATRRIADNFAKSDQSFTALVREVAISKTLSHRSGG